MAKATVESLLSFITYCSAKILPFIFTIIVCTVRLCRERTSQLQKPLPRSTTKQSKIQKQRALASSCKFIIAFACNYSSMPAIRQPETQAHQQPCRDDSISNCIRPGKKKRATEPTEKASPHHCHRHTQTNRTTSRCSQVASPLSLRHMLLMLPPTDKADPTQVKRI